MAEKEENTEKVTKPKSKKKTKEGLSYAQVLEARAQRGSMTHQKRLAMEKRKAKELEGE